MEEIWRDFLAAPTASTTGSSAPFSLIRTSSSSKELRDQRDRCEENNDDDHHQNKNFAMVSSDRDYHHHPPQDVVATVSKPSFITLMSSPFETLPVASSSVSLFSSLLNKNKRVTEDHQRGESTGDRRLKRRLKNRESAARSRARRQAYTSELEREHAQLTEENAKLREQQQKLLIPTRSMSIKKRGHCRSLTAPF